MWPAPAINSSPAFGDSNDRRGCVDLEARCKVCLYKAKHLLTTEDPALHIFKCHRCGLVFVAPTPGDAELEHAYASLDNAAYYEEIRSTNDRKIARSLDDLHPYLTEGSEEVSLLDVGCGFGDFLEAVRRRFPHVRTVGHELPGESADACRNKGLEVHSGPLANIDGRFSIVTMLDVAEHLADPNETFVICSSLLKEGGKIYIHTPRGTFWDRGASLSLKLPGVGRYSAMWLRTRVSIFHLQLWSDRALHHSLHRAGFRILQSRGETEFSWPLERYAKVWLIDHFRVRPAAAGAMARAADLLFLRLGSFKNKAVCLAMNSGPSGAASAL